MIYLWTKLRSWHIVRIDESVTLCGRPIVGTSADADPGERTCERCFQIREADG